MKPRNTIVVTFYKYFLVHSSSGEEKSDYIILNNLEIRNWRLEIAKLKV